MGNQPGKLHTHPQSGRPKKAVHWKSAERPSPPGRPILTPLAQPEQQPDVVNLRWDRPLHDGGSPITGYTVEHRRMGSPHWVRATPIPVTGCDVCISGLEPGWRYQFRCFAENIVGRSDASDLSDPLTVTLQRNAITVPRFIDELEDMNAVEDERIEFRVRILGEPPPEINWFKDGYEIFSSRRTKIVNDNEASVLVIHQVALTDEGEIKCTATNRAGHVVTKARLMVQAPPKIRLPRTYEDGLIVEADEVLRLKVGVAGQPPPAITWLHEGEIIAPGGRFEITNTEKNSLLKIDNVLREDRGEYMVRAWNRLGEDSTSFLVTVTARPNPPGAPKLNMSFGKSATLSWTAPLDDGGCKIGNYIVEYFRVGWNVWLKAATTRALATTLHDLIEGSEYKFRVKAENPYGLSEPSGESELLFIPDPKRGITKPKSATRIAGEDKDKQKGEAGAAVQVPPRRKTLSPPRPQADASTGMSPKQSPSVKRKPKPQLIDNEQLHHEMSYGTSDQALKMDVRKSPSQSSADLAVKTTTVGSNPKLNLTLVTTTLAPLEKSQAQPRSPKSPVSPPLKLFNIKPSGAAKDNPKPKDKSPVPPRQPQPLPTPPKEKPEKASPNRKRSLSPPNKRQPVPLRKSPTPPEPMKATAALLRSAEPVQLGVNQNVRRFSGQTLSPARNVPTLALAVASGVSAVIGEKLPTIEISAPPTPQEEEPPMREPSPSPSPLPSPVPAPVMSQPISRRSSRSADKHDDVHTSNEFMLVVFDKNSKVKDKDKQDSFELDLEDAIQPPPISISAPDLAFLEFTNLHTTFPLRRSVSSTELLYERAMARFYEAVELEQASKSRKTSQDKLASTPAPPREPPANLRKRLGSISEAERVSFERRAELRRQSADMVSMARKWDSRENVNDSGNLMRSGQLALEKGRDLGESQDQEELEEEHLTESTADDSEDMDLDFDEDEALDLEYPSQKQKQHQQFQQQSSNDLGSDYTESTASSEQDSIEKFKMELLARTRSPSPRDLETYHPRTMGAGTFTPYRAPTPEQAAVVLTRPVPLPSPDFVPKPILKRSSNEHVEQSAMSPLPAGNGNEFIGGAAVPPPISPAAVGNPSTSTLKMDLAKGIKSFFSRDKRSATEKNTEANEEISNPLEKTNAAAIAADLEAKRKAKEEDELRRKEEERLMEEEAHAAVDHYSDLVREVGSSHRYHTPLYLDRDELKRAAAKAAAETDEEDLLSHSEELKKRLASGGSGDDLFLAPPVVRERRLSISEREQLVHVRDAASNLAIHRSPDQAEQDQEVEREEHVSQHEEYLPDEEPEYPTVLVVPPPKSKKKSESETESVMSEMVEARPDARGRTRLVKVKRVIRRRVPSSTRSRDTSLSRPALPTGAETSALVLSTADRELLEKTAALAILQSEEQAHEKVRSALSYSTDLVLFLVACYVYLFKDARLVLPILGLIIYRQLGDAVRGCVPQWLRRRLNGNEGS
ncbi:muscle M-line assembly protein unc-89 [Drosophila kikkawai]|uniref:Muscle M-line assembly protein unc-89 n=1 Tax=Drosophila kikkawai TaxID=30033 RepID=A0A6P4J5S1_DROKI|nr:titin homolog [Drosophila kikkawai]